MGSFWGVLLWGLVFALSRFVKVKEASQTKTDNSGPLVVVIGIRLLWVVVLLVGMVTWGDLTPDRSPHRAIWLTILGLVWFPSLTLQWLLVPLGLVRTSAYFCLITRPVHARFDPNGAAAFHAALAASRGWMSLRSERLDWIERRLAAVTQPSGLVMVAAGLTAAIRGDRQRAREWLGAGLAPSNVLILPRIAVRVARDWLVADRLEMNDPDGANRMACRPRGGGWSAMVRAALAYRALPGTWRWLRVLVAAPFARSRWLTLRWLRSLPSHERTADPDDGAPPLPRAMRALRDVLTSPDAATLGGRLPGFCDAWDALRLDRRSAEEFDAGAAEVLPAVIDAVAGAVERLCPVPPTLSSGETADALRDRMASRLVDEVEARVSAFLTLEPATTPYEVWVRWRSVDDVLEAALQLDQTMAVALYGQACTLLNFALDLQRSTKRRRLVAHAIWLRVEELCTRAGMHDTAALARNNVNVT